MRYTSPDKSEVKVVRAVRRYALLVLLAVLGFEALYSQSERDAAALEAARADLNREVSRIRTGTWLHTGGAAGGVLLFPTLPILLPLGTTAGALMTLDAAERYRTELELSLGHDPLPPLGAARNTTLRYHEALP